AAAAAGLKVHFGSDAKPLQVGRAASEGVRAALLARAGATAAADALEGPQGFFAAYGRPRGQADAEPPHAGHGPASAEPRHDRLAPPPPPRPAILGVAFKHHAACHLAHSTIENALAVRAAGVAAHEIATAV